MAEHVLTDQQLLRISFGTAALVFETVLFILLTVLGYGERDTNKKYRRLVEVVLVGNVVSIMDNLFRVSGFANVHPVFLLTLRVVALLLNVYLTYYVFSYLRSFVQTEESGRWPDVLNRGIVLGSTAYALIVLSLALVKVFDGQTGVEIPNVCRIIIGYVVELYFLLASMVVVVRCRRSLERRAFWTAIGAYTVIIAAIIMQLIQNRGILLNYFGAVIGTYIFYIGVELPVYRNLKKSIEVVQTLAEAIDAKDAYTNGHSSRVAAYTREIAKRAGYSERELRSIYMAGLLHDVGKIGIPDAVITKPGRLTDEEYAEIKQHPVIGAKILENIRDMPSLSEGARWHHERYDGRGYPDGLKGEQIPEKARIIAVADAYDAMTSNRSYRSGMQQEAVKAEIERCKGAQFDPRFADIMLQMIREDKNYEMRELR